MKLYYVIVGTNPDGGTRLKLSSSRQLSKSAIEFSEKEFEEHPSSSSLHGRVNEDESHVVHKHRHISVAQKTHTFFANLKSRWVRSRSKERKKLRDSFSQDRSGRDSDYAADYSSEHSRSSSATQSPAKRFHIERCGK